MVQAAGGRAPARELRGPGAVLREENRLVVLGVESALRFCVMVSSRLARLRRRKSGRD